MTNQEQNVSDSPDQEQNVSTSPGHKSDFLAAEAIKVILKDRKPEEQERIIRWVGESLGLSLHLKQKVNQAHAEPSVPTASPESAESEVQAPVETGKTKDIRSFVQEKQPKNDIQFVATVAYYHRFLAAQRKESITATDLQDGARLSSRPVFKAPSITLNNAVQQGYLDRGGRGEYKLNAVGENLVAMTLPGSGSEANSKRTSRSRKANGKNIKTKKTKRSAKR